MNKEKGIINLTPILLIIIAIGAFYFIFRPKTPDYSSRLKETAQAPKEEVVTVPRDWPVYVDTKIGISFKYPPDWNIITPEKEAKPKDLYISQDTLAPDEYLKQNPGKFDLTKQKKETIDSKTVIWIKENKNFYRREYIVSPSKKGTVIIGATLDLDADEKQLKTVNQIFSSIKFTE